MQLDLVVIRLTKKGFENKPSYSLTVYGDGRAAYESQSAGKIEKNISQEQILSVFSSLKDSGFFMMDESYNIDVNSGKAYTEIYAEMPGKANIIKRKKINYYDDYDIPAGVLNFEDIISKVVDTEPIPDKKPQAPKEKFNFPLNMNMLLIIACIAVVLIVVLYGATSGMFFSSADNSNESPVGGNGATGGNPEIVFITTTSFDDRIGDARSETTSDFNPGDTVYVDYEIVSISHNGNVDVIEELTIYHSDGAIAYKNKHDYQSFENNNDFVYIITGISTDDELWVNGSYSVEVKIADENSEGIATAVTNFSLGTINEVNLTPELEIIADTYSGPVPLTVNFDCTHENFVGEITFTWDFGDGNTAKGSSAVNVYDSIGEYEVNLTAVDGEGNVVSDYVAIGVKTNIELDIIADPISGLAPLPVSFSCTHENFVGDITFTWDFGDGNTNTGISAMNVFYFSGDYEVTLIAYDEEGNTAFDYLTISVDSNTGTNIVATIDSIEPDFGFYVPSTITLTGNASGGTETGYIYEWDFDYDGETFSADDEGTSVTHTYETYGMKIIVLQVTDSESNEGSTSRQVWVQES